MVSGAYQTAAGWLVVVTLPFQTAVGLLFWTLSLRDPWSMFPRRAFPADDKVATTVIRQVLGIDLPRRRDTIALWVLMHVQHTAASSDTTLRRQRDAHHGSCSVSLSPCCMMPCPNGR